jgi:hypothetical protein
MKIFKPTLLFEHPDGWRIVQIQLPEKQREPAAAGSPPDDGLREVIEVTDGRDDLGVQRWKRLDTKSEGVAQYNRVCHGLKRELLMRLENPNAEN